ncbi:MAG: N-acetyltransferase [Comamonadaceae bacterium]|nr:MAG: N-acetyltransferase [Comamonadaceae bacterium]
MDRALKRQNKTVKNVKNVKKSSNDYVIRVLDSPLEVDALAWNELLAIQDAKAGGGPMNPFMRHEYLAAMHESGSAIPETGWTPRFVTLWQVNGNAGEQLAGACALYFKAHSYGEYVFDWAWANAYQQHGLAYYPKALIAAPFTPVPGARLLARTAAERELLVRALLAWCGEEKMSSLHMLFASDDDIAAAESAGMMLRHTVQFHWTNRAAGSAAEAQAASEDSAPSLHGPKFSTFDSDDNSGKGSHDGKCGGGFLQSLNHEKRKKIRQERRKVADAGVTFRWSLGAAINDADWDFFYSCYERTYYEHGNAPYLSRDFFHRMQHAMPENWLMFIGERGGEPMAASLIAIADTGAGGRAASQKVAFGRYWGAQERVDCLHFEACYYQPLAWCIEHGFDRFEGGAQGEHKMARALLPVRTTSAHWLAHPAFADAVERFLEREGEGIEGYMQSLERRSPFRAAGAAAADGSAKETNVD